MSTFKSLFAFGFAVLLGACQSSDKGDTVVKDHEGGHQHDAPSVHGMLMVGDGPVYLSHLPMFHKPHDYQVVVEVELVKPGTDPLATYVEDRAVTGEKIYTVVPEPFSLPDLFTPANAPLRQSFKASLWRGHFERGGSKFLSNVTVKVKRVVHGRKFAENPSPLPNLQYILFGDAKQLFAAHRIQKKPDFDHVLAVRITEGVLTDEQAVEIRRGALFDVTGLANEPTASLKVGQDALGSVKLGEQTLEITANPGTDFYLETGDLSF